MLKEAPALRFDADTHSYWIGDERLPAVSDALSLLYGGFKGPAVKAALELGTAVHSACELDDLGELDEESLVPVVKAHLDQYRLWKIEHEVTWDAVEVIRYHDSFRYAGTIDRFGTVDGVKCVVDLKTGRKLYESVPLQLVAYQELLAQNQGYYSRAALLINADKSEWQTYPGKTEHEDWNCFLSLLNVYRWRNR